MTKYEVVEVFCMLSGRSGPSAAALHDLLGFKVTGPSPHYTYSTCPPHFQPARSGIESSIVIMPMSVGNGLIASFV